ncbi:Hydrogen peroxide-inducible protein activator [Cystobacter fuscus DSM 2262]|uniref:Hydrogen peroxide-inducible protein activator n=1 Tax=Cystobacter fuscus (strain ATCC 25194 / DSM 2262 / NBRC 100088 / M29) TaxID=1242864 RepID=S9NYC9_CYSF2|nr:LysR substrate-binding domain-containing protein [Cystobacter fuscus]EPX57215.1 Hydrogen peroxide-inducible protein activator [Cystobacter fuscus DSM 2262]
MGLDLTDLRLFLLVVEAGSITHGAERAHLALASASARIRGLEDELGVALLERERRGVRPTPAGRALAQQARAVLRQVENLRGELGGYAGGVRGQVRLLSNTAALTEFLPEALSAFLTAHPEVDVELEERLSHEIVQAVAEGRAEVGLVADTVELGALETFAFQEDRLVVVMARGHPLAARRTVAFAEVLDEPFVGLGEGSALQEHLAWHAARLGRRPRYRVRLRSFDALCRMVERGVGVGVIPEAAARRCQRSMAIRRVALSDAWATRRLILCVRDHAALSVQARLLVETLRADGSSRGGRGRAI